MNASTSVLQLIHVSELPSRAWKNGAGTARDLLLWPDTLDPWLTISVADIVRDGPFSPYPGAQRWFGLLQGAGVELSWPRQVRRLHAGHALLRFDGGQPPSCRLMGGPASALNVVHRRDRGRVVVRSATPLSAPPPDCGWFALFVREPARLQPAHAGTMDLPPWSLVWGPRVAVSLELPDAGAHAWWVGFDERRGD